MELLISSKETILDIRRKVETNDPSLFVHESINRRETTSDTISIVMTSSNRSVQTYFTLKSICRSSYKDVHVVLVDDSDADPIKSDILGKFPLYIDFIRIRRENKNWTNPVVNYNIGFKFIRGGKVVIQNAEVCHIGDPLQLVHTQVKDDIYYAFDVLALDGFHTNDKIYKNNVTSVTELSRADISWLGWYQHSKHRNCYFHFFTALTRETFDKINDFSYDYTMGKDFDDNDFVLKTISQNITLANFEHEKTGCMGLHLYHQNAYEGYCKNKVSNEPIFYYKKYIWDMERRYISLLDIKPI